ncbi:type I restriction-modification system subunit M [Vibrio aestuarianus]|uniref:site-specific DNA-methyltransferase (adenine-specific) n=2 Tax=Vibrio aestuarianus TaxID=28171 RepID=A0ABM9FKH6_9VIBR|nr:class I SAM-dependent DNA methyltransferase [Vibrio aestuarianus]MDE1214838.1 type I restriction-modification system subunit M [Vibrio aestuarianus]MDE1215623.1 type I restriction-modification system subunit M [Vibrio aestuarianus]MDE1218286.1 type I restriction-modification system subunit M [Vibrio aestuarianus]MDE1218293.1 type I restriction-modification system subunit M [Vibrio aestuarianus]MDE1218434.1 type I restriction-modification system subunit M [Vibrio aestuarianus]
MSDFKKIEQLEKQLWSAADSLRANTGLTAQEYSRPILGLIFLRYAEFRFTQAKANIENKSSSRRRGSSDIKSKIQAEGAMYVPDDALYSNLLALPEGSNIGVNVNNAMKALEAENEAIKDALPKTYTRFDNDILKGLLKNFSSIDFSMGSDVFGRIYEYFLNEFAKTEGQGGGEFFTPSALVRLITEVIEPYHGKVFDPACGSGGMFVSSADFVSSHNKNASDQLSIFGQEKTGDTVRLSKMNLAVHGLQGDIREGNSYYENPFELAEGEVLDGKQHGQFDYVMANPPFNVNEIQKGRLEDDKKRFPFGMPRNDNGNYLWIQMFYTALNETGRAGFVMANSASDARGSELEIRQKLIEDDGVDVMVAVSSNFFYTVTLPCALWFLDKNKPAYNKDKVLFIDARHIFRQVTRAVRDYTSEQLNFIANIVRLYRGQDIDNTYLETHPDAGNDGKFKLEDFFANDSGELAYQDIAGLCKVASKAEIIEQSYSLNPGRYVGVAEGELEHDEDFAAKLGALQEELEILNTEAHELENLISENVVRVLGAM